MARICARCRLPVARGDDHVCLDDDDVTAPEDPQDAGEDEA